MDSSVQYIYFQYLVLFCEAGSRERHKRPLILRPTFIRWHFTPYIPWWHSRRLSRAVTGSSLGVPGIEEAVGEARVEFCWPTTSAGANSAQKTLQWVICAGLLLKAKEPLRVKKLSSPTKVFAHLWPRRHLARHYPWLYVQTHREVCCSSVHLQTVLNACEKAELHPGPTLRYKVNCNVTSAAGSSWIKWHFHGWERATWGKGPSSHRKCKIKMNFGHFNKYMSRKFHFTTTTH